jgi:HK97 family phage prohead protease
MKQSNLKSWVQTQAKGLNINDNWQFGSKTADIKAVETENQDIKIGDTIDLEGYLSTFGNVDRQGDIVLRGAFAITLSQQSQFPLLLNHENETNSQCGSFKCQEDDYGLFFQAKFLVTEETIHEARLIKAGHLSTCSMGGLFKYKQVLDVNNNAYIEEVRLYEGSIVPIPANEKASFISLKSLLDVEKAQVTAESEKEQVSDETKIERIKKILKGKK